MSEFPYNEVSRLVGAIGRLGYGQSRAFERCVWNQAIPRPDPISQLLLASSGHRPEIEREPLDWVRFWVNGTDDDDFMKVKHSPFFVREDPMTGDLVVSLPVQQCPNCKGVGKIEVRPPPSMDGPISMSEVPVTETYQIELIKCDHAKSKDDRTAVSWP